MKPLLRALLSAFVLAGLMAACSMGVGLSQTDVVNTAVAGTQQSQALAQATVNAAVLTAMPLTPTPGPPIEYVMLTEEELAALIDETVAEAVTATGQTTTAVTTTTSDEALTAEEVEYLYDYYYYADYYVQYADELIYEYYDLYAELAEEMILELNAIEADLALMSEALTQVAASLETINSELAQGLAVAAETITQLESAAGQAQANAAALQAQAQDMLSTLQTDQQGRLEAISQIQPNNVPSDRLAALQSAFTFIDTARSAQGDGKVSRQELLDLAQLGANARAGFQGSGGGFAGGPGLSGFSGKFDEITTQFARGQMPQARGSLDAFEVSLGQRPDFNLPGGGLRP